MEYVVKGKITLEDYADFNRAALIHKKSYLLVLLICLFMVFSSAIPRIIKNPSFGNIIAQFLPFLIVFFIFKLYRNYSYKSDRTLNDEITLTLSEDGINYASYRGSYKYTLEDFRKIIVNNKIIAIYVSYRKAILIPRHFFTSKEEELEIESFIKEKYSPDKK
ncbi:YcxB family protein [Treponema saccharophilum]|uniref:YcxB family protein n=1 Tax=Treponema saccharophilum TaxID=165 RepID=UPI00386E1416